VRSYSLIESSFDTVWEIQLSQECMLFHSCSMGQGELAARDRDKICGTDMEMLCIIVWSLLL
jgi:hypothetical protein